MSRPRILAYAYDIAPDRGSEPGAGWALVRILARFADVTVITRSAPPHEDGRYNNWRELMPEEGRVDFVLVPLPGDPPWTGADQRLSWWSRQPYIGYLAWQICAGRVARRLHEETPYDLTWHVSWANGWLGSTLSSVDAPFVLGPIGGGVGPPWRLALGLGSRGLLYEIVRALTRTVARAANPLAHRSWRRARLILVQNRETLDWLPAAARRRARIFHNATIIDSPKRRRTSHREHPPSALFAGRLVAWKGCRLAVRAIAGMPRWRLIVCGDGPDIGATRALADELGVADRVEFLGWQDREEVLRIMAEDVDVFLFPSLHDEAGLVVAEAAAIGLPIVCLDRGGPPTIAGWGVLPSDEPQTLEGLRTGLAAALDSVPPPSALDPASRGKALLSILREAGLIDDANQLS